MNTADALSSWVTSANGHPDFPLANLPFGIFSRPQEQRRGGVAIGDCLLDLAAAVDAGVFQGPALVAAKAASLGALNAYFALDSHYRHALRAALQKLLAEGSAQKSQLTAAVYPQADCQMHLPAQVGDYTDFYVGIHHAHNVGKLFRPDNPLMPNYKYVPIGYHGRASSLNVSGTDFKRPIGQTLPAGATEPVVGPCKRLDYELELGVWIGQGNAQGQRIDIASAHDHIVGLCLLNDWSARDIQAWEYQPLGPFLSKSFATTLSPWVITAEALAPFRCAQGARPDEDPQPLEYLLDEKDQQTGAYNIELEVLVLTQKMRDMGLPPQRLALSNTQHMYWTVAQMITHHTVNGCNLKPGDLLGTGTLSGPTPEQYGSLLEVTEGGRLPFDLASGETRTFLEDGDEIIMKARCHAQGFASIGFGECRARVQP